MSININAIKGILLDYGGTIDTNGIHWADVLWNTYSDLNIPVNREQFYEAYVHGERTLAKNPIIKPDFIFRDVLNSKISIQMEYLVENNFLQNPEIIEEYIENITERCNEKVKSVIVEAKPILEYLRSKYPVVLVSNFYGNISAVLKDFGIYFYFDYIVESAVVGIRKPDSQIFTLGVQALDLKPEETVVIGDSYSKDIEPGKKAGCNTIWLNPKMNKEQDCSLADEIITNFTTLKKIFI